MFALTLFIGIYSYLILMLGIAGVLYKQLVVLVTIVYVLLVLKYFKDEINFNFTKYKNKLIKLDKLSKILILLIFIQAIVNLIGVLGPEIGFDALWYHLTLPKLFLLQHKITHITGGLFYYSDMPKLGETFFISALSFGNEILAKFIHYIFGILCLIVIYKLSSKFADKKLALLACLIFYSNLVVGWESVSAYIDLFRAFFEIMALWAFIEWKDTKNKVSFYESAIFLGLAISSKLIAVGSLLIFVVLIFYLQRKNIIKAFELCIKYCGIAVLTVSPWLFYSFINTGNPVYPLFTNYYPSSISSNILNPIYLISTAVNLFLKSSDPISPIYIILIPITIIGIKKFNNKNIYLLIYSITAFFVWYLTPQTGGGRFILPYLPVFSILAVVVIDMNKHLKKYLIFLTIIISIISIGYRGMANSKYLSVILGGQSKEVFMSHNLKFSYGDFYDIDGFFEKNIKQSDNVILYGFHNLFYVNFPFTDSSYVKKGDKFNYVAIQNGNLPERFKFMNLVYSNPITNVNVYSWGGKTWQY